MAYSTPQDITARKGTKTIADLVMDDGTRAGSNTNIALMQTALNTNTNLLALLDQATGTINAYVLQGARYKVTDLESLTDGPDKAFLTGLCCELGFFMLCARRGRAMSPDERQEWERAEKTLERLEGGHEIFNIPAAQQAGLPGAEFPSQVQYATLGLLADRCRPALFPARPLSQIS